jgi:hypothetical protein
MSGKVIQGSFLGGQPKLPPPIPQLPPPIQAKPAARPPGSPAPAVSDRPPGPPAPAFVGRPPGPPAPAFAGRSPVAQRHGAGDSFSVDPGQLGLTSGGGRPLPEAVRGKMEAALGADFSNVRVYVGPQAERIGAIAFTLGSDIYFAPGRYQPDTVHGQQLLGHELAHVVQQRAGRVRNPLGSGIAVVQDTSLEAEADRLGQRAAAHQFELAPGLRSAPPSLQSKSLQQKKKSKRDYQAEKKARKKINVRTQTRDMPERMAAEARGPHTYYGVSGDPNRPGILRGDGTPWAHLDPATNRRFECCAEADVYSQIISAGQNPRLYTLYSYNPNGHVAPPCANCALWVNDYFGRVIGGGLPYRPSSTHGLRRAPRDDVYFDYRNI